MSDMADIVEEIGSTLKAAIDAEEKRLLSEKTLLITLYEGITQSPFESKSSVDLGTAHTLSFIKDLAPDFYQDIQEGS